MKSIFFGNYWQSNNNEKEPIEWLVLKEDDDKMYVLSKYCLDCIPYSDDGKTAWKLSLIRKWLNNYFLNEAFSLKEQEKILLSDIKTQAGGWFAPRPFLDEGQAVRDKVFLPSIAEAILYFDSTMWFDIIAEQNRIARPTSFAYERGCWVSRLVFGSLEWTIFYNQEIKPSDHYWKIEHPYFTEAESFEEDTLKNRWTSCWYLRSPGYGFTFIDYDGKIKDIDSKKKEGIAVRPAMWVKK